IVLISDGNENLGNAEEQARIAKQNQVQIDVLPLGKGQRNEHEVLVQSVEAPPLTEQGSRFPIRVLIRSYNPHPVRGTLTLEQVVEGRREHVAPSPWGDVVLRPGLNSISFPPPKERPKGSYTYEAKFKPEWVVLPDGRSEKAPLGRIQNKQASTHVLALGQRRILFVEGLKDGKEDKLEHDFLVERLRELGDKDSRKFRIDHVRSDQLPKEQANLGVFLSNYDCVVLANAPADDFTDDQQEMIRSNTYDQGCGLIMIGGPDSFGAGGWQNTAVEKALPVDCEIKSLKVQGKGGLVLIMHACEMGDGNIWEKKIAKLAIDKLGPMDMIGITGLGWQGMEWHVPFQTVEGKREQMKRQIDKMTPMDMPEFDTGLKMAHEKLTDPKNDLAKKHVIIISDGDPQLANQAFLAKMKADKVTVTTVGVATHGAPSDQNMNNIAVSTGGRYHNVKNPNALPQIYTKETRLISQSFIYEKRFLPKLIISEGPTAKLPENLEALYGFVRTTPKQSPLVQMSILGPPQGEQDFPVLAQWHYGLGKAAAFTSDARSGLDRVAWDRDWAGARWYTGFWEQMLDYAVRSVETGRLTLNTEYRDGKVKVIIDARDRDNRPLTDLTLRGGITPPGQRLDDARKYELKFEQKNSGQYEAEFKADEAGSYFLNAQAKRLVKQKKDGKEVEVEETDSVRTGVTIPYSPEFADMESNVDLLERLRAATGGMTIEEDPNALNSIARSGTLFRPGEPTSRSMQPIWFWLVFATGVLLFFDVAVRRIAVEPAEIYAAGEKYWQRLRGTLVVAAATPQFLDRLKTKKAEIGESLEKKAQTRFEPTGTAPLPPPPGADIGVPQKPSTTPRPVTPKASEPSAEAGDFASRLMRAKRKAMEDRDKKQE
ncbi:MAG: VWA domain-containing protein, partial [Planctomycetia bacterium]|nr:VWA domain-containing protein [Planctomycetia bacterium]